ncbi:MAG: DUF2247 family protein [Defluviitaleaceae bacterium]|nr:DUF2247 family protein [Defluviitaleaceae bacterium]
MEYQINRNSLNISISYSYFSNLVTLNWNDILFAIEHRYLPYQAAIEHSSLQLSNNLNSSPQEVLDLVCLTPEEVIFSHSIHPYIDKLVETVPKAEKEETIDKIMYVLLDWIFENQENFDNPLEVAQIVYADFDYPKSISEFVGYMPSEVSDLNLVGVKGVERMLINWKSYLEKEKLRFSPPTP